MPSPPPGATPALSLASRIAHTAGFVALAAVSVYGVRALSTGDWHSAGFWRFHLAVLPIVFALAAADMLLEGIAWVRVMERFGLRVRDATGLAVFFAANAGRLLPAQLGRLIRPEALLRLGRGSLPQGLKAEAALFVLDAISVLALLAALAAARVSTIAAPLAAIALIASALFLGDRVARLLAGTKLEVPHGFWWSPSSAFIVLIQMGGWTAHGLAFWAMASRLPGSTTLFDAVFAAPASAVLGMATSLPGGIGAVEGLLGASLVLHGVPQAHLAVAVAAFRLVTFWIWIPLGWILLLRLRRASAAQPNPAPEVAAFPPTAGEPVV